MMKIKGILFTLLLLFSAVNSQTQHPFTHMYQFGDSINDVGNLIRENSQTGGPYARLPYGKTVGGPTGRASDGHLIVDHLADHFHIPHLPPYLAVRDEKADSRHGVNFAVAGSAALSPDQLGHLRVQPHGSTTSLNVQLNEFKVHLGYVCHGNSNCIAELLSHSLIVMGETGGNDYNFALVGDHHMNAAHRLVPHVVNEISEAVREVIHLGATRIIVPGNFAIGCMPIYLQTFNSADPTKYDESHCLKDFNNLARVHNDALKQAIEELKREYPRVTIVYADYYNAMRWLLDEAHSLGFTVTQRACCGDMNSPYGFDLNRMCGRQGSTACPNPNNHISWDGIHLTGHAYQRLAAWLLYRMSPQLH